ncbi:hypothetical protein KIN20_005751 [Parelaphostrongylus tenuis]|uniref:Uncharacterized protein n=1 Tax=Parelaphostrongylus tenuis TaxID=148309 RepID=A0AAD5M2L8_PARTN|nr:hypothetical protein KIN20_005751 [Parelaphostrongylus tenuis]
MEHEIHECELQSRLDIIINAMNKMALAERAAQTKGRAAIRRIRRFVTVDNQEMKADMEKMNEGLIEMDVARHEVKNTKTKEELEEKGTLYQKTVRNFNEQASKIQLVIDELSSTIYTNQREVVRVRQPEPMFPPDFIDAVKISLLNEPIYHGQLSQASICEKIHNDGDFLIQDGCDSQSLLLTIFRNGVRTFLITIEKVEDGVRFKAGSKCFASLNDLTFQMKTVQIDSETIRLGTAIYRNDNCGRFGAHCVIEEPPRSTLKTIIPLSTMKHKSVVVPLKMGIIHDGNRGGTGVTHPPKAQAFGFFA